MRKAINENPMVQIAVLAGAAVVLAVVFMIQMGGGAEPAPDPAATAPGAAAPATPGAAAPSTPGTAAPPTPGSTASPSATTPGPATSSPDPTASGAPSGTTGSASPQGQSSPALDLDASDGLPAEFVRSYGNGDEPVAIFVVRDKPVSDSVIGGYANRLQSDERAAVFTIGPSDLADWVRVVGPVGVDRTPALIVVSSPGEGAAPVATVSYGFRNYESVRQAVADARYDGPVTGYDPG